MVINKAKVKKMCKEEGKRCSEEFILALDYRLREIILRAVQNAKQFKTLKASELG
jgi:hypothetical protein